MALSTTNNKVSYSPTTATTSYQFNIPYFNNEDISVSVSGYNASGNVDVTAVTTLVYNSSPTAANEFNITPTNGDPAQGAVITTVTGYASGTVTISRIVAYTQEYDLQEGSTIDPTALNKALDRVVAQNQQQNEEVTRQIIHPVTDPNGLSYTVGNVNSRKNKALGYDASGNVSTIDLVSSGVVAGGAGISVESNQISANVDNTSIEIDGNSKLSVKDDGITNAMLADNSVQSAQLANNAVQTSRIQDDQVTYAKLQDVTTNLRALGAITAGTVGEIPIDTDLTSITDTHSELATAKAIKAYVDAIQPTFVAINGTNGSTPLTFTADVRSSFGNETTWNLSDFTSTGAGNTPTLDINKCTEIHINITIIVSVGATGFSAEYPDETYREIAIDNAGGSGDSGRMDFVARVPINPSLGQTTFKMKCLRNHSSDSGVAVIMGATQF